MTGGIRIVLALLCALSVLHNAFAGVEVEGDQVIVGTTKGRLIVDRGVIVSMTNDLTGEIYTTEGQAEHMNGLLWRDTSAWLDEQATVTCEKRGENEALLSATLADGHDIAMTITIEPKTQDILIQQSGVGKRKGLYGIQWGIAGLDASRFRTLMPGYSGVCLDHRTPAYDLNFVWPTSWEVQMIVVEGGKGGFTVWSEDTRMRFKALRWQRHRDQFTLGFQSHNYAPFDELTAVDSVEWRIGFYEGDWRVPAKRYRDWMEKTYGLTRLEKQQPGWVKGIRFLVIMGMDKDILNALKAHVRPSATLLYVPNWRRDGYDRNYPDYTAREEFPEFVRYARAMGYHVMPHMNYFGCDPKNPAYERFKQWHMRNPFTGEPAWWIPPRERSKPDVEPTIKFAYINPASKAWRDELTRRLVEAQRKYGFDAMHLDQTLGIINDANGKIDGLYCAQGNVLLHRQLREAMPEVALSGEGLDEVTCRYEAFAQRHAARAVNHVYGTWDDEFIACGHPISSYFLTPYTTIYGYLGMACPTNRRLYLAWKRAYENWGVIPTYSRPSSERIEHPDVTVVALLREARTWIENELVPDFESDWPPRAKFKLRGKNGVSAIYEGDDLGGSKMLILRNGRKRLVYAVVKGRSVVKGSGSVGEWFAFDHEKLFGLDPEVEHVYIEDPRDLHVAHIARAPDDALIRVLMRDDKKFLADFKAQPATRCYDFIKHLEDAQTGIIIDGRRAELDHGAGFRAMWSTCGGIMKHSIHAHPPWRVQPTGLEPARTFGLYIVDLPADERPFLEFAIGLRDGVNGRSDGVQFIVEVDGEIVFDELWAKAEWKLVSLPLDKWRGKQVGVTFITTTGPNRSPSFDWACWGEPRIRFETPPRRIDVSFACPTPVGCVVGPDPEMRWRLTNEQDGMHFYDVNLRMPGRVVFLWEKPRSVTLPLDLTEAPFTVSMAVDDAPAKLPIEHAGAGVGSGVSAGTEKRGIIAHPPNRGRTSVDYVLQLPENKPATLGFAVGLRDGSKSESVIFIIEANGRELFRKQVTGPDGWHPGQVDLSEYAGKPLLLSLVVDSDGTYYYDWAAWAEPAIRAQ